MIYLIGGPPKCGKTTLAKTLSKSLGIPWVSTDSLQCVIMPYLSEEEMASKFPTNAQRCDSNDEKYSKYSSKEIIDAYQVQAKTSYRAIEMFVECEIADENDCIIEGYHIEPQLVAELILKHPEKIKSVFLVKTEKEKFISDIKKSTTPNDWIIARTHNEETYYKIAEMICEYSNYFIEASRKHNFSVMNMDSEFKDKIKKSIGYLSGE